MKASHFRNIASYVITGALGALLATAFLYYMIPAPKRGPIVAPAVRTAIEGKIRKVHIPRAADLSFRVPVEINGQAIEMLVDTGANVTVLTQQDAFLTGMPFRETGDDHLYVEGISGYRSQFRKVGDMAMKIGPISIISVPIAVDDSGELTLSILGQDAFCNLRQITIQNNAMEMIHDSSVAIGCES